MRAEPVDTSFFQWDGRGPELRHWIYDKALIQPAQTERGASLPGTIYGAVYQLDPRGLCWVVFNGLQVLQIVPEEVHAYWFCDCTQHQQSATGRTGVWRIEQSVWLNAFNPAHLAGHHHFVLEFYDELLELVCRELVFGEGVFDITLHPELALWS